MTVRVSVTLCFLLILTAPAAGAEPAVVVLGDSLSSGYGLGSAPSWVVLLEERLEREAYEYEVINASIAGDTSTGGLNRLPRLLERFMPSIVIIELGGNDGLRGQPVSLLHDNLARIIELVLASGAKPLLTGIQIPPNYGPTYTRRFAEVYAELAEQYHIAFVPFLMDGVALDPARMQADHVHPNAQGQPEMLENVWPVLVGLL
jgi:acyl-CoA thioesterase-1